MISCLPSRRYWQFQYRCIAWGPAYELCGDGPEDFRRSKSLSMRFPKVRCRYTIAKSSALKILWRLYGLKNRTWQEGRSWSRHTLGFTAFSATTSWGEVDNLSIRILNQIRETLALILLIERFSNASCLHSWVLVVRLCPFVPVQELWADRRCGTFPRR